MDTSDWVVLASAERLDQARKSWEKTVWPVVEWPRDIDEGGDRLEDLFEGGRKGVAIFGGDELVGSVVTAYWRRRKLGGHSLQLWPLDVGEETLVARELGRFAESKKAVRAVVKGVEEWERRRMGTLKVTASTEAAAWYGFSFAAGWAYRVAKARAKARKGATSLVAAAGGLARDTLVEEGGGQLALRVAVDHCAQADEQGSMVASTLGQTYFGLGAEGEAAVLWQELATPTLMRQAMTPQALKRFQSGGRSFESLHLDTPQGWVLDGRLHGGGDSGIVQVTPGPTVDLVWPRGGLVSRVRRLV